MFGRQPGRAQARPSARTRRLQAAVAREERLRRRGVDTDRWRAELEAARDASVRADALRAAEPSAGAVPVRRVLGAGVLLAVAGVVVGGFLLWQRVDAFNSAVSSAPSFSSSLLAPLGGTEPVNVAFLGYAGREGHGGRYLSDSINILSIDPSSGTTMVPVPRDLWVEGHSLFPENAKVNEAFAVGWDAGGVHEAGRAATDVLAHVTGLAIDHWIALDFDGLAAMVDAVGGVTIENPRAFAYTMNEVDYHSQFWDGGRFEAGTITLDGAAALDYARARYTSDPAEVGDFARSERQQRVLNALRAKIGSGIPDSIGPGLALMGVLSTHLATDLSVVDLALLTGHLSADRRIELSEDVILQATTTTDGRYVLVVIGRANGADYGPLHTYLAEKLAEPMPTPVPSPSVSPTAAAGVRFRFPA